jgi:hypothetical protein
MKREHGHQAELERISTVLQRLSDYRAAEETAHEETENFVVPANGEACQGCGSVINGEAFQLPRLPGYHCSLACIKAHLSSLDISDQRASA